MWAEVLIFAVWLFITCLVTGAILNWVWERYDYSVAAR
jgi:hypothetical protein